MAYLLAVNRTIRGKLPKDATPGQWARYNDGFTNVELTAAEIAAEIQAGYAIAAQHDGRRKRDNWRLAQHIGIDLDDGALSWDEIVNLPWVAQSAAIIHTTASHTPAHGRYRVVFLLEDEIRDPDTYTLLVWCLLQAFETADPHCKDPSRLFFGAPGCGLLLQPGNVLTSEDIANLVTAYPPANWLDDDPADRPARSIGFKSAADHAARLTEQCSVGAIIPPGDVSPRRLEAHTEALLDKVRYAPDGAKWATLRDVSITFGGYVAGGYYPADDARRWLRDAIGTRRATVASMPAAYDTIDRGLSYGQLFPLFYERTDPPADRPTVADLRARIDTTRRLVIAQRIAELETAILAADMDAPGFDELTVEYARLKAEAI